MAKLRHFLFITATVVLIAAFLVENWQLSAGRQRIKPSDTERTAPSWTTTYEESTLLLQAKISVKLQQWVDEQQKSTPHYRRVFAAITQDIKKSLDATLGIGGKSGNTDGVSFAPALWRKELILADYFALENAEPRLCVLLEKSPSKDLTEQRLNLLVLRVCRKNSQDACPINGGEDADTFCTLSYSPDEAQMLRQHLGWFGSLLLYLGATDTEQKQQLAREIDPPTQYSIGGLLLASLVVSAAALLSVVLFLHLLSMLLRHRLVFTFTKNGISGSLCLEIFCLYLAAMYFLPRVAKYLIVHGLKLNPLAANALAICIAVVVTFWPLVCGENLYRLRRKLGLIFGGLSRVVNDLLIGPYIYLCSLSVLLVILLIYAAALNATGVDPTQGTHPIIPILSGAKDKLTAYLVVALAVIIAPLIEEVMFRGALYAWLREKLSALPAMFFSALLFAAIHPQGPIGILPLTCIGFVLAFLREWRGSLVSCIIAHACFNGGTLVLVYMIMN